MVRVVQRLRTVSRKGTVIGVISALVLTMLVPIVFAPPAQAAVTCAASDTSGNASGTNFTVSPSHGKAFYIDSSTGQDIDAAYVGYVVSSAAAKSGLWASLDGFTGGVVSLANSLDGNQPMDTFAAGASQTMYFLLKARSATTTVQKHTFKIWDRRPDLAGAGLLYSCDYSFSRVRETIKANPNKVTSVTVTTQSTPIQIGQTVTVVVNGDTGTIGAGSSPDGSAIWLSPVVRSSWPTRAIRLESVSILLDGNVIQAADACATTSSTECLTNTLLVSNALTLAGSLKNNAKSMYYRATYTFRVIGRSASAVQFTPAAQIASGTQMKHTPMDTFTGNCSNTTCPTLALNQTSYTALSVSKTVTSSTALTTATVNNVDYLKVPYRVTVSSSNSVDVDVDQVIDKPNSSVIIDSTVTPTVKTFTAVNTSTTANLVVPSKNAAGEYAFSGPFTIKANQKIEVDYTMLVPKCPGTPTTYSNTALAKIGDALIGSNTVGFAPGAEVTTTCGSANITAATTTVQLETVPITEPATSIGQTGATLNGTVDSNGVSGQAVSFEYGTTTSLGSTVSVGTTTTSTDPVAFATTLSGLTQGTLYYFRIRVGSLTGSTLSFVTSQPVATPTVVTDPASSVTTTNATMNGRIDPNLNTVSLFVLINKTSSDFTSGTTYTVQLVDDNSVAYDATTNPYSTLSGAFESPVSITLAHAKVQQSGIPITQNDTYYYRYRVSYVSGQQTLTVTGATQSFVLRNQLDQTITFNSLSDITYGDPSPVLNATATSTLAVSYTATGACSVSNGVITINGTGLCTITASQAGGQSGNNYYNAAPDVSQSFTIGAKTLTVNAAVNDKQYDSTTAATFNGNPALVGVVGSDVVVLTTPTITFNDKNVGNSKTIVLGGSGFTLGGASASNYVLDQPTLTASITAKALTVTAAVSNKEYDRTTSAAFASGPTLNGVISGDTVTLNAATPTFSSVNVATGVAISINAGAGFSIGGADATNYTVTQPTLTANITTKALTVTATVNNRAYNGSVTATYATGPSLTGVIAPDDVSLAANTIEFASKQAADGVAIVINGGAGYTIAGAQAGNYSLTQPTLTANITKKALTVTVTVANKVYDRTTDATISGQPSLNGVETGDDVQITSPSVSFGDVNVGANKAITLGGSGFTISGGDAGNYTVTQPSPTADITTKTLTVAVDNKSKLTSENDPAFSYTLLGCISGDTCVVTGSPTYSRQDPTNNVAGTYSISADISGMASSSNNYALATTPGTLTISSKLLPNLAWVQPSNIVYGTTLTNVAQLNPTATTNAGASIAGTFTFAIGNTAVSQGTLLDAGTYTITATFTPTDSNTYNSGTVQVTLTVTPKTLTITATVASKEYDRGTAASFSSNPVLNGVLAGDVNDVSIASGYTVAFQHPDASNGISITINSGNGFSLAGNRAANYSLTQPTLSANITKKELTIAATITAKTYDGGTLATYATGPTLVGVLNGDTVALNNPSFAFSSKDIGLAVPITVSGGYVISGAQADNYSLIQPSLTGRINPITLTVSASISNRVYDRTSAASLSGAATLVGVLVGESVSLTTPASFSFADATVGNGKAVTPVAPWTIGNAAASNYTLTQPTLTANITTATLTVTADNASKLAGGADPQAYTYTVSGCLTGDTCAINGAPSIVRDAGEAAGMYPIRITAGTATSVNANYQLDFANGTFTISNQSVPVITWANPAAITYGTAVSNVQKNAAATFGGNPVAGTFDYTYAGGALTNQTLAAGTYVLTAIFHPTDLVTYEDGVQANVNLVVNPAPATVSADNKVKTEGNADPALTFTVTGLVNGDTAAVVAGVQLARVAGETPGTYAITPSNGTAANYTLNYSAGSLTVNSAVVVLGQVITFPALTDIEFGSTPPTPSATASSGLPVSYTAAGPCTINAGVVTITGLGVCVLTASRAGGVINGNQYSAAVSQSRNFTISATPQVITFPSLTDIMWGQTPLPAGATASSSLSVIYTASGPCNVTERGAITVSGLGMCAVTAAQPGGLSSGRQYQAAVSVTRTFAITPAAATVAAVVSPKTYDRFTTAAWQTSPSVVGVRAVDIVTLTIPSIAFVSPNVGACVQVVTATPFGLIGSDAGKYLLEQPTLCAAITPAVLRVTANDALMTAGAPDPSFAFTVSGCLTGDSCVVTGVGFVREPGVQAGRYAITPMLASASVGNPNYSLLGVAGLLTIVGRITPTLTATSSTFTYGSTIPTDPTSKSVTDGVTAVPGTWQVSCPGAGTVAPVGTYTCSIAFTPADPSKFVTPAPITVTYTVTPAALTLVIANVSKFPETADPVFTYTLQGLVNGDGPSVIQSAVLIRTPGEDSGQYPIRGTASARNYRVTVVPGTLTIVGRSTPSINASNMVLTYGVQTPAISGTATVLGLNVDGRWYSVCQNAPFGFVAPVGTYSCSVGFSPANTSLFSTPRPVVVTLQVQPAPVTVTVANATKYVSDPDPTFTYAVSGLQNGDSPSIFTVRTNRQSGNVAGTYAISAIVSAHPNYRVTVVPGILTVRAVPQAPAPASFTPTESGSTDVSWTAVSAAESYVVRVNETVLCTTTNTRCTVGRPLGPLAVVTVAATVATGRIESPRAPARYVSANKAVLVATIYFDENRSNIDAEDRTTLMEAVRTLREQGFDRVLVTGHTDGQGGSKNAVNLGNQRAQSAARFLSRYVSVTIGSRSFGEKDPVASNATKSGQARNRRAVIYVLT